jgi:hypothetical protein
MRIYLPATLTILRDLHKHGEIGGETSTAFAITPALREWYLDDDEEVLEYQAFTEAARAALRLLDADPLTPRRRAVLAADIDTARVTPHPELDRAVVRVAGPITIDQVAAIHLDGSDAEPDVAAASAVVMAADLGDDDAQFTVDSVEDHELEWYGVQELPNLVG